MEKLKIDAIQCQRKFNMWSTNDRCIFAYKCWSSSCLSKLIFSFVYLTRRLSLQGFLRNIFSRGGIAMATCQIERAAKRSWGSEMEQKHIFRCERQLAAHLFSRRNGTFMAAPWAILTRLGRKLLIARRSFQRRWVSIGILRSLKVPAGILNFQCSRQGASKAITKNSY